MKFGGVDELHAAFLNESRTRGCIEGSEVGNPGSLGMTNLGPAFSLEQALLGQATADPSATPDFP